LPFDQETGITALEKAEDVLINPSGQITTLRGRELVVLGPYHSFFEYGDVGLVAKDRTADTAIYAMFVSVADGSAEFSGVCAGLSKGKKIEFCNVDGKVFFSNGSQHGTINSDFSQSPWAGDEWYDKETNRGFAVPPPSDHFCTNAGRIYFTRDNVLYYTEFGMNGLYDPAINGEAFPSKIIMVVPAIDGLYVSDQTNIYFLQGLNPKEWTARDVSADYPAIEWAILKRAVDPSLFGFESEDPTALIGTKRGPCLLLPGGQIENLIQKKVAMPDCPNVGAITVFDDTLIIQTGDN
ncbi:MAG: hypothetical protein DRH10_00735, partial [Deltaproteobacteria bacterium]